MFIVLRLEGQLVDIYPMQQLPDELLGIIFDCLPIIDLCSVSLVNWHFYHITCQNNLLWKKFLPAYLWHKSNPYKHLCSKIWPYQFAKQFEIWSKENYWVCATCDKQMHAGNIYRVGLLVSAINHNTSNGWNVVVGIVPSGFDLKNSVPGYKGDGGYGLAFSSGEILDSKTIDRANMNQIIEKGDIVGIEMDWKQVEHPFLRFSINGTCKWQLDVDVASEYYFAIACIHSGHMVRVVPWN